MISVYCVLLEGKPFLLDMGDGLVLHGFYRNEYVLTSSREKAVSIATARALKKLQRRNPRFIEYKPLKIIADTVKSGMPIWWLLRNEGFIFFTEEDAV